MAKYESKIKCSHVNLLEMIKENSLAIDDKKKADIVIFNAIMNLMTTRQRDDKDLTNYTKHFKVVRDPYKEKYGGIFKIPTLIQKESTWALRAATRQNMQVSYPSCISRIWIKQSMVHSSRRWQKTLPQVRRMSTQSILRMCNLFCPCINMTKLITISGKSNEMITTKVTCRQRMTIILPLGMYLIQWMCPSPKWKDNVTHVALRVT